MSSNKPVDARVRLAIVEWAEDAPRGAVTTFCLEHEITRKTFYKIRAQAREDGSAAALQPRSRRPKSSPTRIGADLKDTALQVRASLERSGLDHGPISVSDKLNDLGLGSVSAATLARVFRIAGVAREEPRKKPRAAYRRFVYPAPNACWQVDATEYVLSRGRKCVIFQLIDDHSRLAIASLVARSETSKAAIQVMRTGVRRHGVPQRLLSDNGVALNPIRRGVIGQLFSYASSLGVEPITGKLAHPTTQGKNERFHRTLFLFLAKQPQAETMAQLQAQVDAFDDLYNTQRRHQSLPGRITPAQAWAATPRAPEPKPRRVLELPAQGQSLPDGVSERVVKTRGAIQVRGITFQIGQRLAGKNIYVVEHPESIAFFDARGLLLLEHPWPPTGTTYVSNGKPQGRTPKQHELSPMS